jgi:hypothetical protein
MMIISLIALNKYLLNLLTHKSNMKAFLLFFVSLFMAVFAYSQTLAITINGGNTQCWTNGGNVFYFNDIVNVPGKTVTEWQWNFGDGTASFINDHDGPVNHSFTPPASNNVQTFVVTLKIFFSDASYSFTTNIVSLNPTPVINNPNTDLVQVVCNGSSTNSITFSSTTASSNTTYAWTNNTQSIGLAGSGTGKIATFTGLNSTSSPVTGTVSVIPTYTNQGVSCSGTAGSFTITVNPTPVITPVTSQTVCNKTQTSAIIFTASTTPFNQTYTTYTWTNDTKSIGLDVSGTGNIAAFTALNPDASKPLIIVTAKLTVTPTFTYQGVSCPGNAGAFNIIVNPTPSKPVVTVAPASPLCQYTYNQNFTATSTSVPPTGGITWGWEKIPSNTTLDTTTIIFDHSQTDTGRSIISFPVSGTITVRIFDTISATKCFNSTDTVFKITPVSSDELSSAVYFTNGNNLVCALNTPTSYQWGYDLVPKLIADTAQSQTEQNWTVGSLNYPAYAYWVITSNGSCYTKNYYIYPNELATNAQISGGTVHDNTNLNLEISSYPNPAVDFVTLSWNFTSSRQTNLNFVLTDLNGRGIQNKTIQNAANSGTTQLAIGSLSPGVYLISVYRDNQFSSVQKVIKY